MITISIIGLDSYVVRDYSLRHTKKLAELLEIEKEKLNFYAPNCAYFHEGADQTSWNILVRINAPEKYQRFEKQIAKYIGHTLTELTINVDIEFYYYQESSRYEFINDEYPRFLREDNSIEILYEEIEDDEEVYDGNIFEDFEK